MTTIVDIHPGSHSIVACRAFLRYALEEGMLVWIHHEAGEIEGYVEQVRRTYATVRSEATGRSRRVDLDTIVEAS